MNGSKFNILAQRVLALITATITMSLFSGCGNKPLLTELETNKLLIIIKGTYESNSPQPWSLPAICSDSACSSYSADHLNLVRDDNIKICTGDNGTCLGDVNPTAFMLDIAEMKLVSKSLSHFKFSNNRQTFAFSLNDAEPFFNGFGTMMDNDDVPADVYPAVLVYVRKMLMDGAIKFVPSGSGWSPSSVWDTFAEKALPSFNFNQYQVSSHYDKLRLEGLYLNRVYPLIIPIRDYMESWVFNKKFPYTVLEIRFVVKNFVKKYEYENYENNSYGVIHYYAFSDSLSDVDNDETVIGGNLLTVARTYTPGFVGEIRGANNRANAAHIIAIPANEDPKKYTLSSASVRKSNNCNIPQMPGETYASSISHQLDIKLRTEKFKVDWNKKVPSSCMYLDNIDNAGKAYVQNWDSYAGETEGFMIPTLAVFNNPAVSNSYIIENVSPGSYDLYISSVAPTYGQLYKDGEFIKYQYCPVTVTTTGFTDAIGNSSSIDFP